MASSRQADLPEKITAHYRSLFNEADDHDLLQLMVCYNAAEECIAPEESDDPIGDCKFAHGKIVHRYPCRALLLATGRCAAHCRFCFRRGRLSNVDDISDEEIRSAQKYLRAHHEIEEVVLSGGDPLSLSNARLTEIIRAVKGVLPEALIRIHTRFPIYDPARCHDIAKLAPLVNVFVLHINHPREITAELQREMRSLSHQTTLLNQSVLLKGVNDSVDVLADLSKKMFAAGVLPYYLHYPDAAPGISHFRIPAEDAMDIIKALAKRLSGYLVPRLMIDNFDEGKKLMR